MRRRSSESQFSLIRPLLLSVGVAFFGALLYALVPQIGWIGAIVFFVVTSPFWFFLIYAFNGLLEGGRGGRTERDLPAALPPGIAEEGPPADQPRRKRRPPRDKGGGWWHPLGGYNKQ